MEKTKNWGVKVEKGYPTELAELFFKDCNISPCGPGTFSKDHSFFMYNPSPELKVHSVFEEQYLKVRKEAQFTLPMDWDVAKTFINMQVPEEGKYYKVVFKGTSYEGYHMIGKVIEPVTVNDSSVRSMRGTATYICSKDKSYQKTQGWCYASNDREITEASKEEIEWLDHCIELDGFVKLEDIKHSGFPTINGYPGKVSDYNSSIIEYGCARIDIKALAKFYKHLYKIKGASGNRWIDSINLNSGVTITFTQAKEIIDAHKSFVQKQVTS